MWTGAKVTRYFKHTIIPAYGLNSVFVLPSIVFRGGHLFLPRGIMACDGLPGRVKIFMNYDVILIIILLFLLASYLVKLLALFLDLNLQSIRSMCEGHMHSVFRPYGGLRHQRSKNMRLVVFTGHIIASPDQLFEYNNLHCVSHLHSGVFAF